MATGITSPLKVVVCGSGHGAHVFTALAASRANTEVRVLTTFRNYADRWNQALKRDMLVSYHGKTDQATVKSRPALITKDPAEVVPTADVIVIVMPAYAHGSMLTAILPHYRSNTLIAALPAHPGFDFQFTHVFGDKAKECTVVIFETLAWACRIVEFGTHVRVHGTKEYIGTTVLKGERSNVPFDSIATLQMLIGENTRLQLVQHCLIANLMTMSILVHPTIMYGKWKDWDGTPLKDIPLFYQGVDDKQADLMSKVSDEILLTAKTIKEKCVDFDLDISPIQHVRSWTIRYYGDQVKDKCSLKRSFQTNQGFNDLVHHMKEMDEGGYVPDFSYRYIREDVPFGLVVWKGIAQIVNVPTPVMDVVICWAQKKLGEEYLVGAELKGRDLHKSRAPQAYGINTVGHLLQ